VWEKPASAQESYIRLAEDGTLRIKTPNFNLDKNGNVSIMGNITAKGGKNFNLRADDTSSGRTVLLSNDPATHSW
jgi:hypothetical protein